MSTKGLELDMPWDVVRAHVVFKVTQDGKYKERRGSKEDGRLNSGNFNVYISKIWWHRQIRVTMDEH